MDFHPRTSSLAFVFSLFSVAFLLTRVLDEQDLEICALAQASAASNPDKL